MRRIKSRAGKKMKVVICVVSIGMIIGGCLFGAVNSAAAEEKAVANKSWNEVQSVIETKLGTGYEAVGQCTGYLYWCLKNAYGVDMGTNSVVKTLENKLITAGATKVGEGVSGEITSDMKAGDIVIFYNGSTAVHCAILGNGGTIYHATTSAGVTKSYTLKRWMALPDSKKNCDRYIVYRGLISTGTLTILKSSTAPEITDNNSCYSLAGAEYGLYSGATLIGKLVTDKDGRGVLREIPFGSYTLKELVPAKGYAIDDAVYEVTISGGSTVKELKEKPQVNRISAVLYKVDTEIHDGWNKTNRGQAGAALGGALYAVNYYDDYYDKNDDFKTLKPARSWVISTDESGQAVLEADNVISGDELYADSNGAAVMPLGTVMISEMKAPEGYLLNDDIMVMHVTSDGTDEEVDTYVAPVHEEQIIRGDIKLIKIKDGTMERLGGVPFTLRSKSTGEVHTITTDANGYLSTSADWNPHTFDTNGGEGFSGMWFGDPEAISDFHGALPYDTYILDEMPCEANEGLKMITGVEVAVYRNNFVVDMGTITNDFYESTVIPQKAAAIADTKANLEQKKVEKEEAVDTGDDTSYVMLMIAFSLMLAAVACVCTVIIRHKKV